MATLQTLPVELFEKIAHSTNSIKALSNLRLVNRDFDNKTRLTQSNSCFREKGFMINSERSLRAAVDLVRNPRFGPQLRRVYLFVEEFKAPERSLAQVLGRLSLDRPDPGRGCACDGNGDEGEGLMDGVLQGELLTQLFEALEKQGVCREVVLTDFGSTSKWPVINDPKFDVRGCRSLEPPRECSRAFHATIKALASSGLKLESFTTAFDHSSIRFDNDLDNLLDLYKQVFANVRHLELKLSIEATETGTKLCSLLSSLSHLRTLYLSLDRYWCRTHMSDSLRERKRIAYQHTIRSLQRTVFPKAIGYENLDMVTYKDANRLTACLHSDTLPRIHDYVVSHLYEGEEGKRCFVDMGTDGSRRDSKSAHGAGKWRMDGTWERIEKGWEERREKGSPVPQ